MTEDSLKSGCHAQHAAEVVRAACRELQSLQQQRVEIMKRISTVKQTIVGLAAIFGEVVPANDLLGMGPRRTRGQQIGLTNACRLALMQSKSPMRSHQVRDSVIAQGLPLAQHKDPIATVTTILNRLVEYGEARAVVQADGKRAWEWTVTEAEAAVEM